MVQKIKPSEAIDEASCTEGEVDFERAWCIFPQPVNFPMDGTTHEYGIPATIGIERYLACQP